MTNLQQRQKSSILNAARFKPEQEQRLREACTRLGCQKTDLIVAGTMAEIERRLRLVQPKAEH